MTPLRLALVCAFGVLLVMPQAAAGGGWWSSIDVSRSTVAPGQRVEVHATVAFESVTAAREARDTGRFYVHLLRGYDDSALEPAMRRPAPHNWWALGGAEAIPVGPVSLSLSGSNVVRASAAFTVPELPPSTYHLMLCDAACAQPLADDVIPEGLTVVADPATAEMARRLDRLERRLREQAGRLTATRADAAREQAAARHARSELEQLERTVSALPRDEPSTPPVAYAGWLVAGVLAGALFLLALRRRPSPPRPARNGRARSDDDELRELLASVSRGADDR